MARKKLSDDVKKPKIGITLNKELDNIMSDYIKENKINRSKYIENLIKEDMLKRGKQIKKDLYYLCLILKNKLYEICNVFWWCN